MNQPRRFKADPSRIHEATLIAFGLDESPPAGAVSRAAHRLGVPASALTAGSVTTALAPAASASTAVAGGSATGAGSAVGSVFSASAVKAVVVGLALGAGVYGGVHMLAGEGTHKISDVRSMPVRARVPAHNAPMTTEKASNAVATAIEAPTPVSALPRIGAAPNKPLDALSTVPRANPIAPVPASAVARFEDTQAVVQAPAAEPPPALNSPAAVSAPVVTPASQPDPRLAQEVSSLDRARRLAHGGDANGALRELDTFAGRIGYSVLRTEASLVRIDVLLALGRGSQAAVVARQLLEQGAPAAQRAKLEKLANDSP